MPFRTFILLVMSVIFGSFAASCGGEPDDESAGTEEANLDQGITFTALAIERSDAPAGLTVIKNTKDYRAFFGSSPPSSVDFKKHWVVNYSRGEQTNGAERTEITRITKTGSGDSRTLVVETKDTSPGEGCLAPAVITHPQVTVVLNKQPSTPKSKVVAKQATDDCGAVPCGKNFCTGGDVCCNESCGICTPPDGACIQIVCEEENPDTVPCGSTFCTGGDVCCNESCGICTPPDGACIQIACEPDGVRCGDSFCPDGEVCCNDSCGICTPPGGACIQVVCE